MSTKYDEEIREVEARLIRERQVLAERAEDLSATAREAAASPKGLLIAFAVGFLLSELTAPKKRGRRGRRDESPAVETTKKLGLGGLIGSALVAYARTHYGSPLALGRHALNYYLESQRARQAAMQRSAGYAPPSAPATSAAAEGAPGTGVPRSYPHPEPGAQPHVTG